MINVHEAQRLADLVVANIQIKDLFEKQILETAEKGYDSILIDINMMPLNGVDAFRGLGYKVDQFDSEERPNTKYNKLKISW